LFQSSGESRPSRKGPRRPSALAEILSPRRPPRVAKLDFSLSKLESEGLPGKNTKHGTPRRRGALSWFGVSGKPRQRYFAFLFADAVGGLCPVNRNR